MDPRAPLTTFPNTMQCDEINNMHNPRNRQKTLAKFGGEDPSIRFLSSHKRQTEEGKERGTSLPLIHQKRNTKLGFV